MLKIRAAQLEALSQAALRQFVERGVEHLERVLPERCRELGREEVRQTVERAMEKAGRYGLTQEYDVLRLLNCMCVLGFDFDTDARYPWAAEILNRPRMKSGTKMDFLTRRAELVTTEA